MKIEINAGVEIRIDTGLMLRVPDEKIEQCIGQILVRFSRWTCSNLIIVNDGKFGDLVCYFYTKEDNRCKLTLGANWRPETQEYTFNS